MKRIPPNHMALVGFVLLLITLACSSEPKTGTRDAQIQNGKAMFAEKCASCHGMNDVAPTVTDLDPPAPDLTQIMNRRPRATEFPIKEIARFIDGRRDVKAHGPRAMPVWGEVFASEGLDADEIRGKQGELIAYLIAIQE